MPLKVRIIQFVVTNVELQSSTVVYDKSTFKEKKCVKSNTSSSSTYLTFIDIKLEYFDQNIVLSVTFSQGTHDNWIVDDETCVHTSLFKKLFQQTASKNIKHFSFPEIEQGDKRVLPYPRDDIKPHTCINQLVLIFFTSQVLLVYWG